GSPFVGQTQSSIMASDAKRPEIIWVICIYRSFEPSDCFYVVHSGRFCCDRFITELASIPVPFQNYGTEVCHSRPFLITSPFRLFREIFPCQRYFQPRARTRFRRRVGAFSCR